jgi:DNA polymerase-3 subunit delta'
MWQGIEGHDAIVEYFRETLQANRLASTYLFIGPEGVGKRLFALKIAQTLLCTDRDPAEMNPCGQCESCRLALTGGHPDLDVVALESGKSELSIAQFIGKDDKRNQEGMCHNIALRPMIAKRRVAIIDDADWFNTASANCLLKTLEEPPPNAVIILVGTSRSRQLPTILSRAQIIRFQSLSDEMISNLVLDAGITPDAAGAARLAARAGGSMTQARELADAALWEMRDRVCADWDRGEIDGPRLARDVEEFVNEAGKEAEPRRERLRQLLALFSRSLSSRLGDVDDATEAESLLAAIDRCLEAIEQIDRNANQSTLIATWIDDLAQLRLERSQPTQ